MFVKQFSGPLSLPPLVVSVFQLSVKVNAEMGFFESIQV